MKKEQLAIVARRGLTLPDETRSRLHAVGVYCDPNLSVQRQHQAERWVIRGQESGGASAEIGRYVSFCREDGSALAWLQPVRNFMPNGVHAIVVVPDSLVRFDMYRFETSYDLLITRHWLHESEQKGKPELWNEILFFARHGVLERELWGKDKMYRGGIAPTFFQRNGEEMNVPEKFRMPVFKMTEGVTCTRCSHQHLVEAPLPPSLVVANSQATALTA